MVMSVFRSVGFWTLYIKQFFLIGPKIKNKQMKNGMQDIQLRVINQCKQFQVSSSFFVPKWAVFSLQNHTN